MQPPSSQMSNSMDSKSIADPEVQSEPCYHGYLPREDLAHVLQQHGDYILRTTEVNDGTPEEKKPRKKELVLAVLVDPEGKCNGPIEHETKDSLIKNVIVNRTAGRFAIEAGFRFDTISALLRHYISSPLKLNNSVFKLHRAVRLLRWEYYHKDVKTSQVLGSGAFGEVRKGILKKKTGVYVDVAVKLLKTNSTSASKEQINEMMREARLMRHLCHSNVVRIYGVALTQQPLYIILEFVQGGSLDAHLKKHAAILDRDEKLAMVMGAVWGLEYLHQSMILHRDIASRNCLYDQGKNVKISDFGLSRNGSIYRMKTAKKMPIKWMAPESINQFIFTQKTDVYSLGVLIWEIHACKESYDGLSNTDSRARINSDKWNEFPEATPNKLKTYVKEKMWDKDPGKRANMQNIRLWMEKFTGLSKVDGEEEKDEAEHNAQSKKKTSSQTHSSQSHKLDNAQGGTRDKELGQESVLGPSDATPKKEE